MIDLTKIHTLACVLAHATVPEYRDNGTPEHSAWLASYDKEFSRLLKIIVD